MCILLKLDYAKFGVSNLFFSKVIEEKLLGVGSTPLGTGSVNVYENKIMMNRTLDCFGVIFMLQEFLA